MNSAMIWRLVAKDVWLQCRPVAVTLGVGAIAILLLSTGGEGSFYAGAVLLITAIIGSGVYIAITTVVTERTEGMLPFVMSLPISMRDYTLAKLIANLLLFLVIWSVLGIAALAVVAIRDGVPDGLLPYYLLLLMQLLTGFLFVLGVSLVSQSLGWAIGATAVGNLLFQGFMYLTARLPGVAPHLGGEQAVWSPAVHMVLSIECVVIALIVWVTWHLQSRKTDLL